MDDKRKQEITQLATDIYSMFRSLAMSRALASVLYDEGYRKASEVAREIFEEIEAHFDGRIAFYQEMRFRAYSVGKDEEVKYANTMITNLTIYKEEIAELKKKYTEEEG